MQSLVQAPTRARCAPSPTEARLRAARRAGQRAWVLRSVGGANSLAKLPGCVAWRPASPPAPAPRTPGAAGPAPVRFVVPGALHAHTTYSDGCGAVPEVAAAARGAGLRFLVLSDHDTLQPLRDGWQGYHEGLLLLVGAELRTDSGYVLALGLPPDFTAPGAQAGAVLDAIQAGGGLAFAVHPAHPYLGWSEWGHPALAGLEVLNLHSLSRHAASLTALARFGALLAAGKRPAALGLLAIRPTRELALWNAMLAERRAVGLAAADAHGYLRVGRRRVPVPTYRDSFDTVQTHLVLRRPLTGDPEADRRTVLAALAEGRCRMVYPLAGDATGLRFYHTDEAPGAARAATEGETAPWSRASVIRVESPRPDSLHRLYHDGRLVGRAEGRATCFPCPGPGTYRLESDVYGRRLGPLRYPLRPWVFTNPIYLE